jgi:hypothetical protein
MTDEEMGRMPWTSDLMTSEEFRQWIASRKAAGREVDIETCELGRWYAYDADPYCCDDNTTLNEEMRQVGTNRFVRTPESRGWVHEGDLPLASVEAMYQRITREYEAWKRLH